MGPTRKIKEANKTADNTSMEITPIAGIRVLPSRKVHLIEPELAVATEIESAARPEDDTYSPADKTASGSEESEDETENLGDDEASGPATLPADSIDLIA